jgi:hypothetical protein
MADSLLLRDNEVDWRMLTSMRLRPWIGLGLVMCSCGPQPADPAVAAAAPLPPQATLTDADALTGDDVGARAIGSTISVPEYQELQLAAVVIRDGAFSAADSFVSCQVGNQRQLRTCRIIAFSPHGPLRPDATDTLVMVNGHALRFVGEHGATYGHNGPSTLTPGQPYALIADLIYGKPESRSYSSEISHSEGVAFSIHLYARLVTLTKADSRYQDMHAAGHGSSYGRDLPVQSLQEITGDASPAPTPASSASAGKF